MNDIQVTKEDCKLFLLELFRQDSEEIRHKETILNNFLSIFGSVFMAGILYFVGTQELISSRSLLFFIIIFVFSLMGYLISKQVRSQITHLQLQIVSIKKEFDLSYQYISFTDNDSWLLKFTRANSVSSYFFGFIAVFSLLAIAVVSLLAILYLLTGYVSLN